MSRTILHFDWYCSCSLSYYYSSLTSPHIKSASIAFLLLNSLEIPQACWLFFSQNHSRSLQLIGSPSQLQLNIAYLLRSPTFCRFEAHHKFSSPTVTLRSRHSSDTILLLGLFNNNHRSVCSKFSCTPHQIGFDSSSQRLTRNHPGLFGLPPGSNQISHPLEIAKALLVRGSSQHR